MNATETDALVDELTTAHRAHLDRASAALHAGDLTAHDSALDDAIEVIERAALVGLNLSGTDCAPGCECSICWTGPPRCTFIDTRAERVPEGDDGRPSAYPAAQRLINSRAPWSDATVAIDGGILCFECGDAFAKFQRRMGYMNESEARALAIDGR